MLIRRAVEKQNQIMVMCQQHEKLFGEGQDILTMEEWQILKDTEEFLQPFYEATLEGQKEFASLDQALFHMDILFKHFEDAKVRA